MPPKKREERLPRESTKTKWVNVPTFKVGGSFCTVFILSQIPLAFIDKFRYNAAKSSEAQSRIKKLEKMPVLEAPESEYTVHFKFPEVEKLSPPIIQMSSRYSRSPSPTLSDCSRRFIRIYTDHNTLEKCRS
jgi:hypothetical protein